MDKNNALLRRQKSKRYEISLNEDMMYGITHLIRRYRNLGTPKVHLIVNISVIH
jgi:hypothetical protein